MASPMMKTSNLLMICASDLKMKKRKKEDDDDEEEQDNDDDDDEEKDPCLVCGDRSIGLNFGVRTCAPCKAFFRRNAIKLGTYEFQCRGNGDCRVTSETRRHCNCCRLAKCFRVGMNPNAILSDDQRMERNQLIEFNRQKRAEIKTDTEQISTISNKRITIRSSGLSSDDYDLLTNIYHGHEQTCVEYTYKEHLTMSIDETLTLKKFLNASANIYLGLIRYLKLIPEFNQLSVENRLSLIKRNLNQIFRIQSTFSIKTVTPDLDKDSPVCSYLFPEDLYIELRTTAIALTPFVHDPILIKLYIVVLMFSTHMNIQYDTNSTEILDENSVRNTFHAQNIYIGLLWRYILSRSNGNYRQSVQMFTSLIGRTLYSQIIQTKLNDFVHSNLPNQSHSLEPIIKAIWTSN